MKSKLLAGLVVALTLIIICLVTLLGVSLITKKVNEENSLPGLIGGVVVHYQYDRFHFFPESWLQDPINCQGAQADLSEAQRVAPLIKEFISAYESATIKMNLTDIYLLNEMRCYDTSYGSTSSASSIYLKIGSQEQGFTDQFVLATLHSNFASILMRNYAFPATEWEATNGENYIYSDNALELVEQEGVRDLTEGLLQGGFLSRYATTSLESDFGEYVFWLSSQPVELCELRRSYEKIATKYALTIEFYHSVDSQIIWSVCP